VRRNSPFGFLRRTWPTGADKEAEGKRRGRVLSRDDSTEEVSEERGDDTDKHA
jgi:hypothetical protein